MRAMLLAGVATLVLLGGLGLWVASSQTRLDFSFRVDRSRALPQGGFFVGNFPGVESLNPFTTADPVSQNWVLRYSHDCLMRLDWETGELAPAVARLVESTPDGLSYTFEIVPGMRFSDGQPVTVDDVKFTFDTVKDGSVAAGSILDGLSKVAMFQPLQDRRFRLVLSEREYGGLESVTTGYRVVQKEWFISQIAVAARKLGRDPPAGPGSPGFGELLSAIRLPGPGTGPYELARDASGRPIWIDGRELWLVQNPESWQRRAFPRRWNLGGFGFRFTGGDVLTQLKREQIDWALPDDPKALLAANPELEEHYALHTYDPDFVGHYAISWNCERLDPQVRRTLAMLFDRAFIRDDILGGNATLVDTWFRATDPEHPDDLRPIPFDVAAAVQQLGKLGYGPGGRQLTVRILATAGVDRHRRILEAAQSAFKDAGVTLLADPMESVALLAEVEKKGERRFEGVLEYWRHPPTSIDPYHYYHSKGMANYGRYSNPRVDSILERARKTLDRGERVGLYREFCRIVHGEQPVTILVHPINSLILHRRFKNVKFGWAGAVPADWYVPEAEQIHFRDRALPREGGSR